MFNLFAVALFLAVIFGIVASMVALNGWVLTILWSWFIVPVFGLPPLSLKAAMGLSLIVGYLTGDLRQKDKDKKKEEESTKDAITKLLLVFVNPLIVLAIGWLIHSC